MVESGARRRRAGRLDNAEAHFVHLRVGRRALSREEPAAVESRVQPAGTGEQEITGLIVRGGQDLVLRDDPLLARHLGGFEDAAGGEGNRIIRSGHEAEDEIDLRLGRGKLSPGFSGMNSCAPVGKSSRMTLPAGITNRNQLKSASRPSSEVRVSSVFCGFNRSTAFASSSSSDGPSAAESLDAASFAGRSA